MKKLLLALILFITPVRAYAFQDYIVFSEKPVKQISVEDKSIVNFSIVQTIDKPRQTLILASLKEGKTTAEITTEDGVSLVKITVKKETTKVNYVDGFAFVPADMMPNKYYQIDGVDILPPPKKMGGK